MQRARTVSAVLVSAVLVCLSLTAQAQRRRQSAPATGRSSAPPTRRAADTVADARMTGLYQLDPESSDDPLLTATRAARNLPPGVDNRRMVDELTARLTSPLRLTIARRGRNFSIASTRAPRIDFEADGIMRSESAADGDTVRTKATVYGDQLMISSSGSIDDQFSVYFDSIEQGRRLRVTRRIYDARLGQPLIVRSFYDKTSGVARFSIYGEPEASSASAAADLRRPAPRRIETAPESSSIPQERRQPPPRQRPVLRPPAPEPVPRDDSFTIGNNTQFIATLNDSLSTANSREGDRFTLTVSEPAVFAGAIIEGTVARIDRGGRISGRSEMTLNFERIRLPDGRIADFNARIESVRAAGGEDVRVDNESGGNVRENDSQSQRTAQRAAIGAAVGAIIGALSGGGKGAAIGAVIGAGAGAGSVYAQGRDDLELSSGTELVIRVTPSR